MAGIKGRSGPPGNLNSAKHGLWALDRRLKEGRLDGRSAISKWLRAREQDYIAALGGDPSPQEMVLIRDSARTELYKDTLDAYLARLKTVVRKGKVHAVLSERTRLAAHLRENLKTIGLKRVKKELSLQDYLAGLSEGEGEEDQGGGHQVGDPGGDKEPGDSP